jgi:hypothetical protein
MLFQHPHVGHHHAAVDRLAHVVNGQQAHRCTEGVRSAIQTRPQQLKVREARQRNALPMLSRSNACTALLTVLYATPKCLPISAIVYAVDR